MQKIATFDVWGTLIVPDRDRFVRELCQSIQRELSKYGYDISIDKIIEDFDIVDREIRKRRKNELTYIPPEESVKKLLEKILERPISMNIVDDVEDSICRTVSETESVYPADGVYEVLKMFRDLGYRIAIVSNVVFWRSRATRRLLKRFNLDKFDVEIYADIVKEVKPNTRMLKFVENELNGEVVIHIGDSLFEDVAMAIAYGVKAVFIDRRRQILKNGEYSVDLGGRVIVVDKIRSILKPEIINMIKI